MVRVSGLAAALVLAGCASTSGGAPGRPAPEAVSLARPPACSAAAVSAALRDQRGLPDAVAETRRRIAGAASTCNYDALDIERMRQQSGRYAGFSVAVDESGRWRFSLGRT